MIPNITAAFYYCYESIVHVKLLREFRMKRIEFLFNNTRIITVNCVESIILCHKLLVFTGRTRISPNANYFSRANLYSAFYSA